MNLKDVKSVTDKGDHFLVDHGKVGKFKVAKKGLDKNSHAQIQAFAEGGQVDAPISGGNLASAVALKPVAFNGQAQAAPAPGNPYQAQLDQQAQPQTQDPIVAQALANRAAGANGAGKMDPGAGGTGPDDGTLQTVDTSLIKGIAGTVLGPFSSLLNPIFDATPDGKTSDGATASGSPNSKNYAKGGMVRKYADGTPFGPVGSPADNAPFASKPSEFDAIKQGAVNADASNGPENPLYNSYLGRPVAPNAPDIFGGVPTTPSAPAAPEAPEPIHTLPAAPQSMGVPQAPQFGGPSMKGMNKAFDAEKQAVNNAADVERQQGDANAQAYQHALNAQQIASQTYDASYKKMQAQHDAIQQGITDTKIDPQRLWSSQTTGGKVQSILGIMLSGIGAGLSHQPNQAIETLDKLTAQDIDAQKAELGKKENLLSENLRATGDMRLAQQMTQAQLLTGLQTQLGMTAAKFGGPKAAAQAQLIGSQIDQKREGLKMQIAQQQGATAQAAYQQKIQADALGRLYQGQGTPVDEVVGGKSDSTVTNPLTGMRSLAHDKESAKEYREQSANYGEVRDMVSELKRNAKEMSFGSLDPRKRAELETRSKFLALQLPAAVAGLKRLNEIESKTATEASSNPADIFQFHSGAMGKLDALGSILDNKQRTLNNQYLIQPGTKKVQ